MDTSEGHTRRAVLRAGVGAAAAGAVTGGAIGSASAQDSVYGNYFAAADGLGQAVGNFEGTADARDLDGTVPLSVGVGQNGLLFGPTGAVLVEPGTTVEWTWTGNGGAHNVVHDAEFEASTVGEQAFRSGEPIAEPGTTFEHTFETEGVFPYFCLPHKVSGMRGAVVVGEDNVEGEIIEVDFDVDLSDGNLTPIWGGTAVFGLVSVVGVAAYRELVESDRK